MNAFCIRCCDLATTMKKKANLCLYECLFLCILNKSHDFIVMKAKNKIQNLIQKPHISCEAVNGLIGTHPCSFSSLVIVARKTTSVQMLECSNT